MNWGELKPKFGTERVVKRFAWLPIRLSDGRTVWLETYLSIEVFRPWVLDVNSGGYWRTEKALEQKRDTR